jgi:putative glycosyltransferase (TIGR04348 family)
LVIVTPARPGTQHGNRATALRWAAHLRALGHRVTVQVKWDRSDFDAMIALHARRSHDSIVAWKRAHPGRRLALVLTGTDLYRDIRTDADARASLDLADRLVVLQAKGLDELRAAHRAKASVIHQSVRTPSRREPPQGYFLVTVLGHLRDEKDPFCAARALAHLPGTDRIRVVHLGKAMSAEAAREARARMRADPRYRWLGEVPHSRAMRWLARSHAMVISSRMEGGAHVVSEAIAIGVPVIASAIPGNAGLLGADYPGYYPVGDEHALAALLARAQLEPAFLSALARKVKARHALVKPAAERRALRALLGKLQLS